MSNNKTFSSLLMQSQYFGFFLLLASNVCVRVPRVHVSINITHTHWLALVWLALHLVVAVVVVYLGLFNQSNEFSVPAATRALLNTTSTSSPSWISSIRSNRTIIITFMLLLVSVAVPSFFVRVSSVHIYSHFLPGSGIQSHLSVYSLLYCCCCSSLTITF